MTLAGDARKAGLLGWLIARVLWAADVSGAHHVPQEGPVILASNHLGVLDGPLLFGTSPRPTYLLVKEAAFRGLSGAVLRAAGQIPVDTVGGRAALALARARLARGDVVGIFPEGRRGRGDVGELRGGAVWLALASGAPVVPVAILGTRRTGRGTGSLPRLRSRLVVEMGAPLTVTREPGMSGRAALDAGSLLVADALRATLERAMERTGMSLPDDDPVRPELPRHTPE
ncbi:lysophospholipid acyltransferase family protein [Sanguibacter sp. A247]|uniref:lysophospholipid acyltransferase family protein n=1 Tax=unclassified Sanguibacter TaxID=2645534 RepID=UPI003FD8AF42